MVVFKQFERAKKAAKLRGAWERETKYLRDAHNQKNNLAYGGWARSMIGSQNFDVPTKRYDYILFLRG